MVNDMRKQFKAEEKKTSYLNNKGATMMAAIIIMAILIVFTFSLTLIAYTLYASQNKNIASMRCVEAANTLSIALEKDLTYVYESDVDPIDKNSLYPERESFLYRYIRYNICQDDVTWPYFVSDGTENHDRKAACRYFDLKYNDKKLDHVTRDGEAETEENVKTIEGMPGKTVVCIYWMLPEDTGVKPNETAKAKLTDRNDIRLFIEVTSEAASQSYTVTKEYILEVQNEYSSSGIDPYRKQYLKNSLTDNYPEITNPCNFGETDVHAEEKWIWKPVDGE